MDHDTISAAALIISILVGVAAFLARYAITTREKDTDRRLGESEKASAELRGDLKLHAASTQAKHDALTEKLAKTTEITIKQDGEIARLQDKHDVLIEDLHDIKRDMVRREQIIALERNMERRFDELAGKSPRQPPYKPTPAEARYPIPRTDETSSPPPRGERDPERRR